MFTYLELFIVDSNHIMLTELASFIENKKRREISYPGHRVFINTFKVMST